MFGQNRRVQRCARLLLSGAGEGHKGAGHTFVHGHHRQPVGQRALLRRCGANLPSFCAALGDEARVAFQKLGADPVIAPKPQRVGQCPLIERAFLLCPCLGMGWGHGAKRKARAKRCARYHASRAGTRCKSGISAPMSGPRAWPVSASRSGMNSPLPLRPVADLTASVQSFHAVGP